MIILTMIRKSENTSKISKTKKKKMLNELNEVEEMLMKRFLQSSSILHNTTTYNMNAVYKGQSFSFNRLKYIMSDHEYIVW